MATLSWPASLPAYPMLASYVSKADSGIIRTQMESGLARQRKRPGTPTSRVTVQWAMTGSQAALMKAWAVEKAANGAAWFNINLNLDNGVRSFEARFTADLTYRLQSASAIDGQQRWVVSAEIEVKDLPPVSFEVGELLVDPGIEALEAIVVDLAPPYLQPAFDAWLGSFPSA